jgi:type II secretory pathway pseudopilin PulG
MRKEMIVAAVIFGGLAGYALSPLPSFAFQTADQRERIAQAVAQPSPAKPHHQ